MTNVLFTISGIFYSILCIFSIVTGIIYMSGKRKLNPLELSDSFVKRIKDMDKFTKKMGLVTFIVGIVQGLTAASIIINIFHDINLLLYFAIAFTIFSFLSAFFKLKSKWSTFAFSKIICYTLIFLILIFK